MTKIFYAKIFLTSNTVTMAHIDMNENDIIVTILLH